MGGAKKPEAERRGDILAAAFDVFVAQGFDGFTVRTVAREAGLSPGLVFFHFSSKDGLLVALLEAVLERTLDAQTTVIDPAMGPWDAVIRMIEVEIDGMVEQRRAVELLFAFYFARRDRLFRDRIDDALVAYRETFVSVLGSIPGIDTESVAEIAFAIIQGSAMQVIRTPESFDPSRRLAIVRRLITRGFDDAGIAPPPQQGSH
jgi:AcrR family transcriptional regulator